MSGFRANWRRRKEPLVVDRRLDLAAMVLFLIYGLWGILTLYVNTTILKVEIDFYPVIWGAATGLVALVAFVAAFHTFILSPLEVKKRLKSLRIEMVTVAILAGHIAVYPALMVIAVSSGELARPDLAVLSFSYVVFPIWRVADLISRVQQLTLLKDARHG